MDILEKLFERHFHSPAGTVQPLHGQLGGSSRKILRLANERFSAIGVLHEVRAENLAFVEFSRHFRLRGLPVPEIYGEDLNCGAYLEEDLGDITLFDFLSNNRTSENLNPLDRRGLPESCSHVATLSDRRRAWFEL